MQIQSAFQAGVTGLQQATANANQAATDIVNATSGSDNKRSELRAEEAHETSRQKSAEQPASNNVAKLKSSTPPSLTESIVKLKMAEYQAKASSKVINSADQALGTLIDVKV